MDYNQWYEQGDEQCFSLINLQEKECICCSRQSSMGKVNKSEQAASPGLYP